MRKTIAISDAKRDALLKAIHSREPVKGLTHTFYRYPARFSPQFARAAIEAFTEPGDIVFDPFMGGGTTLVEARTLGRIGVGTDISSLAAFVTKTKTTILRKEDRESLLRWRDRLPARLNIRKSAHIPKGRIEAGYLKHIDNASTWRIRKLIALALGSAKRLKTGRQKRFARCAILKTAQWALDCKMSVPRVYDFRDKLILNVNEMLAGVRDFAKEARKADKISPLSHTRRTIGLHRSAVGIESLNHFEKRAPKLILTSPPYPGVHILYHRWQINGRRETPAPFWITEGVDGNPGSYYNFGSRHQKGLKSYYEQLRESFCSLREICDMETLLVQLVAFSDPTWQLKEYLNVMGEVGFREQSASALLSTPNKRLWRSVPNRKWHASVKGKTYSSKEILLVHSIV